MIRPLSIIALTLGSLSVPVLPAAAASFDCAKASSPLEKAICGDESLSSADEQLVASYQTAIGGLSKDGAEALRADQRRWHDYVQRACSPDAEPIGTRSFDEIGVSCLANMFSDRSYILETSRMIEGRRFYPQGVWDALPDPYEADNPDSLWRVATHQVSYPQLDSATSYTAAFNEWARNVANSFGSVDAGDNPDADDAEPDSSSDTVFNLKVSELAGDTRITLEQTTSWYGHGAAHGNYGISYRHYLIGEDRELIAKDIFAGKAWPKALLDLTVEALNAQHGEALMFEPEDIASIVTDPTRWILSDPYDLIVQFSPYEVSSYAYGSPTARIKWEALQPYLADRTNSVRYGY